MPARERERERNSLDFNSFNNFIIALFKIVKSRRIHKETAKNLIRNFSQTGEFNQQQSRIQSTNSCESLCLNLTLDGQTIV